VRDPCRRVLPDCAVEVGTNACSVPWRLTGERVRVTVADGWVRVSRAGREVAARPEAAGRRRRVAEPAHFRRVPGFRRPAGEPGPAPPAAMAESDLPRPLAEYERAVGGGW
jgi:hypothetical protein